MSKLKAVATIVAVFLWVLRVIVNPPAYSSHYFLILHLPVFVVFALLLAYAPFWRLRHLWLCLLKFGRSISRASSENSNKFEYC